MTNGTRRRLAGWAVAAAVSLLPQLLPAQGLNQRIFRVVDLEKMFEIHGRMLAFSPCKSINCSKSTALAPVNPAVGLFATNG